MAEGKRNIINQSLEEYDLKTAEDIPDALKKMMEAEMDKHFDYKKSERLNK